MSAAIGQHERAANVEDQLRTGEALLESMDQGFYVFFGEIHENALSQE